MRNDGAMIEGWFVLNAGFKAKVQCPHCHSQNVSYYKIRTTGLKGISASSKGLTPVCLECGKNLPTQYSRELKQLQTKTKTIKAKGTLP